MTYGKQTIKQNLPSDFQTAEYLMKYGQIDVLSARKDLRENLYKILKLHKPYSAEEKEPEAKHTKEKTKAAASKHNSKEKSKKTKVEVKDVNA